MQVEVASAGLMKRNSPGGGISANGFGTSSATATTAAKLTPNAAAPIAIPRNTRFILKSKHTTIGRSIPFRTPQGSPTSPPAEARLLDAVTDGGSVNPTTGLLEFWGRMGGSKYSREQRAEAEARAASPSGNTENNTQNDGGGSRQKTYPDSQLAGAARANEEAARSREKVRNYLGRNGASGTDSAITRADARALQQADAQQPAEPTRPREQDTNAAATLTRHYAATTLHENPNAGLLTQKSTPAPSVNRYTAATPAPTPTPTTPALSSSMQRAQNAATAAATTETAATAATATATTPMAPDADPRLSPSATPAQQARNIAQARRFTEQQRAAEANANAVKAITRTRVRDYLTIARNPSPAQPQSVKEARKNTWGFVSGIYANSADTRKTVQQGNPITPDWSRPLMTLRTAPTNQHPALASQLAALATKEPRILDTMPGELGSFVGAYTEYKQKNLSQLPSRPNADDLKYKDNPRKFANALENYEQIVARREAEAVRVGVNAAASHFRTEAFQGPVTQSGLEMYAGGKALTGNAMAADQFTRIQSALDNMVPKNYRAAPSVTLSRAAGKTLGFVGTLNPLGGPLAIAGQNATTTMQQGGSRQEAQKRALLAASLDLLGGGLAKAPMTLARNLANSVSKNARPKNFTDLLQGGLTFNKSPSAHVWSIAETAASYAGGTSLGLLAEREDKNRPGKGEKKERNQ